MNRTAVSRPWYREPWPWLLMAGPFLVIIAAFYTIWLAVSTNDGLVTDDYYKKGLNSRQTLARSEKAVHLGLVASVRLANQTLTIRLDSSVIDFLPPATLSVVLSHPTRAGQDQTIQARRQGDAYTAALRLPSMGHWLLMIEDDQQTWRLLGQVVLPTNDPFQIGSPLPAATPTDIRKPDPRRHL